MSFEEKTMKQKVLLLIRSLFVTIGLTTEFSVGIKPEFYETKTDYLIASIYDLLGEYDVKFLFMWLMAGVFLYFLDSKTKETDKKEGTFLAVLFSLCLLLGKSYHETADSVYIFGSVVNFIKSIVFIIGYTALLKTCIKVALGLLKSIQFCGGKQGFFEKRAFLKSFGILSVIYGTVVLISYPGTLCWDVIGQIEQVTKNAGYSAHHPLVHTLLVGGLTMFGQTVFDSYELGLFLYMLLQMFMLSAALATTILVLAKRGMKQSGLWFLLVLYSITPIYSNLASTAIKDVPFVALVVGYFICYVMLLEKPERIKNMKFLAVYVLLQLGVILFRNNGLALVVLSGLGAFIYFFKKYNWKEKLIYLASAVAVSVVVSKLILFILLYVTNAQEGSSGEMLSLPFQQTARYLQHYQMEIDESERSAIEAVLGPVDEVALRYNPAIADDVKALFKKEATKAEIFEYLLVWVKGFIKHPVVYWDAFYTHVYGWFTPGVSNAIRYETSDTDIVQEGLIQNGQKYLIFLYRFANRISILGILENIGAYVWGMFFLLFYAKKTKKKEIIYATIPLLVSLLVCMASPCYILHPRYGLPIIATLPFLYGFMLSNKEDNV